MELLDDCDPHATQVASMRYLDHTVVGQIDSAGADHRATAGVDAPHFFQDGFGCGEKSVFDPEPVFPRRVQDAAERPAADLLLALEQLRRSIRADDPGIRDRFNGGLRPRTA